MSIHHRRHYTAGTSAFAASGQKPTKKDGAPRSTSSIPSASAPALGPKTSLPEAGRIVELHPGSGSLRPKTWRPTGLLGSQAGMATAEYAIATLAAVGFAGLLVFILRSDEVRGFLLNLIRTALALP
ncbi:MULTISPECIES: DUF4244 domain-containing protein [unclassified Arthrobacter]|uniref:DUF4244 domain-containing protein n=1 Tax=unclassified Arthrobacter TaxID=235627 RepID=UPI00036C4411|nr:MULTISPECIES: DUF4244 domain-containing protein [unclassified Arthrobacter]BCW55941.1 hypothetical protein StoSoilB19_33150 [Arthrobacter sp. StoSoilB19]BCW77039.1 hypothetical protein NicSoilB11_33640 [Arthrobacter sp. NicSoilB11]